MRRYALMAAVCGLAFASTSANALVTVTSTTFDDVDVASPAGPLTTIGYTDAGPSFPESLTFTNTLAGVYNIDASSASPFTTLTGGVLTQGAVIVATLAPIASNYFRVQNVSLAPGSYTFTLNGSVTGGGPGVASGTIAIAAVPELGTWGMMLLGVGGIAFALRRRREQTVQTRLHYA